jgi:hypothetical protein
MAWGKEVKPGFASSVSWDLGTVGLNVGYDFCSVKVVAVFSCYSVFS